MYDSKDKMVSHPKHYQSKNGLEVIDVIDAFTSELKGVEAFDTANVIKYICRWNSKNGKQDLEKAMWYLQHLIDHITENPDTKTRIEPYIKLPSDLRDSLTSICTDHNDKLNF